MASVREVSPVPVIIPTRGSLVMFFRIKSAALVILEYVESFVFVEFIEFVEFYAICYG